MKKGFLLFSALFLIATAGVFAQVTAVQEGGVVKVTWTYTNPDATFVGLVGDFQGWNLGGAVPMIKGANGVWTITLDATPTSEFKYKFNVDDEWTEDPKAPAGLDDGFGGTNGYVVVADLLAAASGTAPAAPSGGRIIFGNYTETSVNVGFITKDIKDGKIDGIDMDSVELAFKSYWKLQGPALPYVTFFAEIPVVDTGSITLWKSNTDATDTPFTTWADGLESLLDVFYSPWYGLSGKGSRPGLGHWKTTLLTPYANFFTATGFAKGTVLDETYRFTYVKETDSGDGLVEITPPQAYDFDGLKLSYLLAPNLISGKHGFFGFIRTEVAGLDARVFYAAKSVQDSIYQAFDDAQHQISVGAKFAAGEIGFGKLTVTLDSIYNITEGDTTTEAADAVAAFLGVNLASDAYGLTLGGLYNGDKVSSLFGNDDGMAKGKLRFLFNPFVNVSGIKIGVDTEFTLDNGTSTIAAGEAVGLQTYFKPYLDVKLESFGLPGTLGLYQKVNFDQIDESKDSAMPFALKLPETGLKFSMTGLDAYVSLSNYYGDWDSTDAAYAANGMDVSVLARYEAAPLMNIYAGYISRLQGADETNEAYKKESALGLTLGYDFITPLDDLKKPKLFAVFNYNFDPYDGGKPGFKLSDYRADNLGNGAGLANFKVGLVWDF